MSVLRRSRSTVTEEPEAVDPLTRVSEHFLLSDFLGCQTVYTRGIANALVHDDDTLLKLDNLRALCNHALEPILAEWGPLSVSYGYICPELSRLVVKYQDPDMPSHHRFDLGAAADICVHRFVQDDFVTLDDLFLPESVRSAPIALAHGIDMHGIPYSRLITYSESPYLCLAVSAREVEQNRPRKAFYENRYQGRAGDKPTYTQLPSPSARDRHFQQLQEQGLPHDWRGAGHPTYHGGGYCQLQHKRVSRYTMVSDWLVHLQSIARGSKNVPALNDEHVLDAFAAAGMVYDWIIDHLEIPRMSIIGAYLSNQSPYFDLDNDWREPRIWFDAVPPGSMTPDGFSMGCMRQIPNGAYTEAGDGFVRFHLDVTEILENDDWA